MKNVIVSYSLLCLLFLASCAKEQIITDNAVKSSHSTTLKTKLKRMESALKHPNDLSRSENMSPEEAVWGIEAMMNIYFSRQEKCEDFKTFTETLSIPVAGGVVSSSVFNTAYNAAWQKLVQHYNSVSWTQKQTLSINTKVVSQTASSVNYELNISIGKVTTAAVSSLSCDLNVFNATDNWNAGLAAGEGKCDGSIPTSNAAEELEKKVNYHYPIYNPIISPFPDAPYLAGFIDIQQCMEQRPYMHHNDADDQFDNIRDYLIYQTSNNLPNYFFPDCVEEADMEWYFCNLITIIPSLIPTGKEFVNINMWPDQLVGELVYRDHAFIVYYGTPIFKSYRGPWTPPLGPVDVNYNIEDVKIP